MSIELFVPGRLCLFGEHSDWAGKYRTMNSELVAGAAIVTGTEQGISAIAEKSDKFEMVSTAEAIKEVWKDFSCLMGICNIWPDLIVCIWQFGGNAIRALANCRRK